VPFFGDQFSWGDMLARNDVGSPPIPYRNLNADNLSSAIIHALEPHVLEAASEVGAQIRAEKGLDLAAQIFNARLDVDDLRCNFIPDRVAAWQVKHKDIQISALAATVLMNEGMLSLHDLELSV
jgi:hypothetical protein